MCMGKKIAMNADRKSSGRNEIREKERSEREWDIGIVRGIMDSEDVQTTGCLKK